MVKLKDKNNLLIVFGNIKTLEDYETIKEKIENLKKAYSEISIKIIDSSDITSSLLGYLYKLKEKENINIILKIKNDTLFELLDDLNINFSIEKIQ